MDSRTKLIHLVAATAANVPDGQVLPEWLHGQETGRGGRCSLRLASEGAPATRFRYSERYPDQCPSSSAPEQGGERTKSKAYANVEQV